ncbi:hypothetical protein SDC9_116297 [bioreactor metagenome]|uniref:Uncharacterized protein n=1 Tax=bioreactor metagenome TaxID=1076179 RepID=A0A645BVR0_9ZZZZ
MAHHVAHHFKPGVDRAVEALLFGAHDPLDELALLDKVRVGFARQINDGVDNLVKEGLRIAQ